MSLNTDTKDLTVKTQNRKITVLDLGLIEYKEAWAYQEKLFDEIIQIKIRNRDLSDEAQIATPNYLLFCEHPHVYTLGKSGQESNLLVENEFLNKIGATFHKTNRGGDITYHGPGQIVGYPIFDLDNFFTDIHLYMRTLEEAIILTLLEYGIEGVRIKGKTGVWLSGNAKSAPRKICAMGVRCSRWVTMHGFAFNATTDLAFFRHIVPCGISDGEVTSLMNECEREIVLQDVKNKIKEKLISLFSGLID